MNILRIIQCICFSFLVGCSGADNLCSYTEQQRMTSSDDIVDAVLLKQECGATVAEVYKVLLMKKGEYIDFERMHPIFVADHTKNINISWSGKKKLNIDYSEARIFQFQNFWHSKKIDSFNYIVKILETELTR